MLKTHQKVKEMFSIMKRIIAVMCVWALLLTVGVSVAFARRGERHFKGNCQHAACHCTEFWAEAGTSRCYYCGHMDFMHRK